MKKPWEKTYPINVKTAEPIRPNFMCDLTWPRKGLWPIILKMREKIRKLKKNVLPYTEQLLERIKPQLKVEKEDGREAS